MKKTIKAIMVCTILILAIFTLTGCESTDTGNTKTENSTPSSIQQAEKEIDVYEDSYIKIVYTGIDNEEPGLVFNITNKTSKNFSFAFNSILVNGKTEEPAYSTEVLANSKVKYVCDVSSVENINAITAKMYIYDSDGYDIEHFEVKDIAIK